MTIKFTPSTCENNVPKRRRLQPRKSTIQAILAFAAAYQPEIVDTKFLEMVLTSQF